MQIPNTTSCKQYFKYLHILPLPCLYIFEVSVYIKSNLNLFTANSVLHFYNTRKKYDLFILPCNTNLCLNNFDNIGLRMFNHLPHYFKEISVLYTFKNALKKFLFDHCFYSIDEFFLVQGKVLVPVICNHISLSNQLVDC